jgi:pyruvate dehydrogenase E2 component (dihydrolipoamide acetyltransferase)
MAKPINMPVVGQDIETAVISEWHVKENDSVNKGDIIAVVDSDKASFEVEAFESGTILKLLFAEGDEARVLQPIAFIGKPGESISDNDTPDAATESAPKQDAAIEEKSQASVAVSVPATKIFATPVARRVARNYGIELQAITGSGPGGRIIKRDVMSALRISNGPERAVPKAPPAPAVTAAAEQDQEIPFSKIRARIADRLTQSKQTIPHFYLFMDVDVTAALAWRMAYNQKSGTKVTINDIILKAAALQLRRFPRLNSHVAGEKLIVRRAVNIGVAVSIDDGLLVPVIPDADQKELLEINRIARENAEAARRGAMRPQEPGTFTISNLGMFEINGFLPIINPPESAILGVGCVEKRVVPIQGNAIGIREMMTLSIVCDHRAVDGAYAAQFLKGVKDHLENFTL